jgi:general secretion pathway protein J
VLLATVLLASGLALGFATVRAATATAERGEAMAANTERMRAVEGFLRRRLAAAQAISFGEDASNGGALRFIGEPDRIRFVADLPSYLGRGGPHLHDIAVHGRGDDATLAVSFTMVLAGETIEEDRPRPPEPLVTGLTGLRIRYRGFDADTGEAVWLDAWDSYEELPLQVAIEIQSSRGGAWPALVVALPQAGSTPQFGSGRSRMGSGGMRSAPRARPSPGAGRDGSRAPRRDRMREPTRRQR